jgi:hypothetical protein
MLLTVKWLVLPNWHGQRREWQCLSQFPLFLLLRKTKLTALQQQNQCLVLCLGFPLLSPNNAKTSTSVRWTSGN